MPVFHKVCRFEAASSYGALEPQRAIGLSGDQAVYDGRPVASGTDFCRWVVVHLGGVRRHLTNSSHLRPFLALPLVPLVGIHDPGGHLTVQSSALAPGIRLGRGGGFGFLRLLRTLVALVVSLDCR